MNSSDEKPGGMVITSIDTTESEMLVNALSQIQTDLEKHMVSKRLEYAETE